MLSTTMVYEQGRLFWDGRRWEDHAESWPHVSPEVGLVFKSDKSTPGSLPRAHVVLYHSLKHPEHADNFK